MGNPASRNFPAVVIYNTDCEEIAGVDAGQTVVFMREESPSDMPKDEWVVPIDPRLGIDISESYTAP